MRRLAPLLAALLTAPSLWAAAEPPAPGTDRALLLVGTWSCVRLAGSVSTWTVARDRDGVLSLKNQFQTRSGFRDEFDESYRFDPQTQRWAWESRQPGGGAALIETGTAAAWTGDTWVFTGTMNTVAHRPSGSMLPQYRPSNAVRLLYWNFEGSTFQREIDVIVNGRLTVASSSTCRRELPPPAA